MPFAVPARAHDYEPALTYAERRMFREMLAYYAATRPKLEVVLPRIDQLFHGCPTARRLLDEG